MLHAGVRRVDASPAARTPDLPAIGLVSIIRRPSVPGRGTPARLVPVRASFSGRHLEHEDEDEDMMRGYEVLD